MSSEDICYIRDAGFQRRLLVNLLKTPQYYGYFGLWVPSYFLPEFREIVRLFLTVRESNKEHPHKESLITEVRRPFLEDDRAIPPEAFRLIEELELLYELPITDKGYSLDIIIKFAKQGALIDAVMEAGHKVLQNQEDKVMPLITKALQVGDDLNSTGLVIDASTRNPSEIILKHQSEATPTGFTDLDALMNGGVRAGEMLIFMGPAKGYKSGTMLNATIESLRITGKTVTYITLEMDEESVYTRYCNRIAELSTKFCKEHPGQFDAKFEGAIKKYRGKLLIRFFPGGTLTIAGLRAYLNLLDQREHKTEVLVVDYGQIMKGENEKEHIAVGDIYSGLRAIAGERKIPVITGVQVNREAMKNIETMDSSNVASSFKIVQHADYVVGLIQTEEERAAGRMRQKMILSRNEASLTVIDCLVNYELHRVINNGLYKTQEDAKADEKTDDDTESTNKYRKNLDRKNTTNNVKQYSGGTTKSGNGENKTISESLRNTLNAHAISRGEKN